MTEQDELMKNGGLLYTSMMILGDQEAAHIITTLMDEILRLRGIGLEFLEKCNDELIEENESLEARVTELEKQIQYLQNATRISPAPSSF